MMQKQTAWVRLILHGVLIAGAVLFSLPFVWMIGTSMMSDKELFREGLHMLPRRPVPRMQSPYLDSEEFPLPQRPRAISEAIWREKKGSLLHFVRSQIEARGIKPLPGLESEDLTTEVLKGVWHRLRETLDPKVWSADEETQAWVLRKSITAQLINDSLDRMHRMLCLSYLNVRTKDFRHHKLAADVHPARFWKPLTDNVALQEMTEGAEPFVLVRYNFHRRRQWALEASIDCPVPFETIKSFRLAMRQDETWHRYTIALEFAGQRWETAETLFLGGYQWQQVILRPWDPQRYDPYQPHPWVWLKKTGEGPQFDHGTRIRIEMTVTRSTPLEAWYGKAINNYKASWKYAPFWRYAATSTALVLLNIVLMILASSLAAYAFARLQWPGRDLCFVLLLGTLMIPYQVTLIPGFIIMKWLGWYNTLKPMWIGAAFGNAFSIFLLRQFMKSIPTDLEDAARIDGCGFLRIWWHIMIPLVKPTLAAIAVFTFIGTWNDFMTPLIYLNDQRLYPLALGLFSFQTMMGGNHAMMMASSVIMTLPVIGVFFLAQRYFIQGITLTGMKA